MTTYKESGVDITNADRLIERLKTKIQGTFNPYVLNPIGGFGAITEIPEGYKRPVMVSSTDGVGTKLKIAFLTGIHNTVGIDLVAMCVNDILTLGAKPYFFLDYFACGKIDDKAYEGVISGICEGCKIAGCALIGGETAEMPSFYKEDEYDLAGFSIGFVEKERIIDGSKIIDGDMIIGIPSNGLHSNGYSLVRKVFFEMHNLNIDDYLDGINTPLAEELIKPTKIYTRLVIDILERFEVKGMAHITGGGLPGNIRRIIPDGLVAEIDLSNHTVPQIFKTLKAMGDIPIDEMFSTFNMGIGFTLIVSSRDASHVSKRIEELGEKAIPVGRILRSHGKEKVRIIYQNI